MGSHSGGVYSVGDIAKLVDLPPVTIIYLLKKHNVRACGRFGPSRCFDAAALEQVRVAAKAFRPRKPWRSGKPVATVGPESEGT